MTKNKKIKKIVKLWVKKKKRVGLFIEWYTVPWNLRGWRGCPERRAGEKMGRSSQFSQLGLQWGEVSCGGMEGNEGGLRQAGWPGPLLADGGKRHLGLSLGMLSSAAIVWRVQQQTHALHVSLATRNRNRLPPQHCTHTRLTTMFLWTPVHLRTPQKHAPTYSKRKFPYNRSNGQTESATFSHTPDLRGREREC